MQPFKILAVSGNKSVNTLRGDGVVPLSVKVVSRDSHCCQFVVRDFDPLLVSTVSSSASISNPVLVVVWLIRLTITARLTKGRPRQLWVR